MFSHRSIKSAGSNKKYLIEETDEDEDYDEVIKVEKNNIYFYASVCSNTALELNIAIKKVTKEMQVFGIQYDVDPPPINIFIHSEGGEVHSALAVFDTIRTNPVHINTIITGNASSAATIISMAGHTRKISSSSYMLIHNISSTFWGKMHEFEDEMKNMSKLTSKLISIYKEFGNINKKQLDGLLKKDLLLDANTCLKYGFVDEIC